MLNVVDLFAGIGGFSLGLERTGGFRTVAFCEIDGWCIKNGLNRNWPGVPVYDDVKTLTGARLRADGITGIDVVVGGPPCQPVSVAGAKKGDQDERWLWPDALRLVDEIRPAVVVLENPPGIVNMGFDDILAALEGSGYDVGAVDLPAACVGFEHRRQRIWIIAYANQHAWGDRLQAEAPGAAWESFGQRDWADGNADANRAKQYTGQGAVQLKKRHHARGRADGAEPGPMAESRLLAVPDGISAGLAGRGLIAPPMAVAARGVDHAHRIRAYGNAVVPAVVEQIGYAILNSLEAL